MSESFRSGRKGRRKTSTIFSLQTPTNTKYSNTPHRTSVLVGDLGAQPSCHSLHFTTYNMTGFLDLPKRLRERIYRDALIRDSSTTLKDYVGDCKERSQGFLSRDSSAPPLLKVNAKITREAAPIYYGGNRFRLDDLGALSYVFSGVPLRFIHMIEHVTVVYKGSGGLEPRQTLDRIKNFTHARKVTVIIEEEDLAARELLKSTLVQWHPVIGLSDQLKLWALYAKGTRALAGLAETSRVCLKVRSGDSGVTRKFSTAAIAPYTVKHSE